MANRNREYIELLKQRFNEEKFISFISDLLNLSTEDLNNSVLELKPEQRQYSSTVQYYKYIANYSSNSDRIGIFIVKLTNEGSQNARTAQRTFISSLLNKYNLDASIVSFYQDEEPTWRLSFVKKELSFTSKGIKVELTPAKRYSYLVGENESVHTAQEYLFELLNIEDRKITLEDIEKVFDVEKVTKKFFEEYKEKYLVLKEYLDNNEDFITESEKCDFKSEEFAKKLMGQIVFLYFLQKKGWLGVKIIPEKLTGNEFEELSSNVDSVCRNLLEKYYFLENGFYILDKVELKNESINENINNFVSIFKGTKYEQEWGTGDKQFVRNMFRHSRMDHKNNFFDEYLEPFFYTGLNEKRDNQYFVLFNCKVPFLNGGLFEPLNNYRWSSAQFNIPDEMFSNDDDDGILDIFDLYNFTIDEEEPLEKDIAVDPEMLGKIFENLLDVNDRKSTGSFYTPREIVHYMCRESLANYISDNLQIPYTDVIDFIECGEIYIQADINNKFNDTGLHELKDSIWDNLEEIKDLISNIKICDPAVGSGAFPLGMLNEIVKIKSNITKYLSLKIGDIRVEMLDEDLFNMKLQTIQNSIYAVDLESSAVEIAKLRLWLSLIVDYPNEEEPKPLPNLDFKIMQGNSLIDEFEGIPLFNAKVIKNSMRKNAAKVKVQQNIFGNVADIHIQQSFDLYNNSESTLDLFDTLTSLSKQFFSTSDTKLKKELKWKMESIQYGIIEKALDKDPHRLRRFKELEKKHNHPWFIWQLEFYDVFKNKGGFDIVIANPPYVDSEHMMKTEDGVLQRKACNKKFKSAKGNWDMFVVFIELGFEILSNNGVLSYIIPNKLISANYTKALRSYMLEKRIIEMRDYSNVNVFKSASVYPVTILCGNNSKKQDVVMRVMDSMSDFAWTNTIKSTRFYSSINWDTFFSKSNEYSSIIEKIDSAKRLNEFAFEVKGSATVNEAYLMKEMILDLNSTQDAFKFVNTGTIDPYKNLWGVKATQYIKGKYDYPVINKSTLKSELNNRYDDAIRDKIIIGGMTKCLEAIHDKGEIVAAKSTIEIFEGSFSLEYLIAIINSKLMSFYYRLYYNSSSLDGGFYSINREQIDNLPIIYNEEYEEELISLVKKVEEYYDEEIVNRINEIIYKIYKLDNDEISLIEKYFVDNNL